MTRKELELLEKVFDKIESGMDDYVLWFTGEKGAYVFRSDLQKVGDLENYFCPALERRHAKAVCSLLTNLFGSDCALIDFGTLEQLRMILRCARSAQSEVERFRALALAA